MKAVIQIKNKGESYTSTYELFPDQPVHLYNQRPNGKSFHWVGKINGIEIRISNDKRYDSQLEIDPSLNEFREIIAKAISDALKEWD